MPLCSAKMKFFSSNQSCQQLNRAKPFCFNEFFRVFLWLWFWPRSVLYLVWMLLNWHEMNLRLPLIDFLMDPQRLDEIWPNICWRNCHCHLSIFCICKINVRHMRNDTKTYLRIWMQFFLKYIHTMRPNKFWIKKFVKFQFRKFTFQQWKKSFPIHFVPWRVSL